LEVILKIVIVSTAYPFRGGIADYVRLLYKHLSKRHDVEIVTFTRQYPEFLYPGKTQMEEGLRGYIPTEQLIDSINPLTWFRAAKTIRKMKPDIVLFKYWIPFFAPCFGTIASLVKARIVCILDNVIPHEKRPGDVTLTRWFFQFVDEFIVQSHSVEKELYGLCGRRAKYVPHPISELFGKKIPKREAIKTINEWLSDGKATNK